MQLTEPPSDSDDRGVIVLLGHEGAVADEAGNSLHVKKSSAGAAGDILEPRFE